MTKVCEHEFEQKDKEDPNYSQTEYDLYAKLDMTIRKNHVTGNFEIARISTAQKIYEGTLQEMVDKANELEGEMNTIISCDNMICRNRRR